MMCRPTARQIIAQTAQDHGLTVQAILGPDRTKAPVLARHDAMARVRAGTRLSLPQIGRLFNGRHHTTVLHAVRVQAKRSSKP